MLRHARGRRSLDSLAIPALQEEEAERIAHLVPAEG
jgi:hypothetical protein